MHIHMYLGQTVNTFQSEVLAYTSVWLDKTSHYLTTDKNMSESGGAGEGTVKVCVSSFGKNVI